MAEQIVMTPVAEPALGESDHDKAMIAKSDGLAPTGKPDAATANARPDHIPEKFWDAEKGAARTDDMAKAYAELEAKLRSGGKEPAAQAAAGDPPAVDPNAAAAATDAAANVIGFDEFSKEFAETGKLGEESYSKLAKQGLTKEVVDQYIEGQTAIAENMRLATFAVVGGEEAYGKMIEWAGSGLNAAEIAAYDAAMAGTPEARKMAVLGLKAQYDKANGKDPKFLSAGTQSANDGPKYESMQQATADIRNPQYERDPAFRAAVQAKLDRSFN